MKAGTWDSHGANQPQAIILRFSYGDICTTTEEVIHCLGVPNSEVSPKLHDLLPGAIEEATRLAAPVFTYALHTVKTLAPRGNLLLKNGISLELPRAERFPDTRYLAACVCTLGGALEGTCRELGSRDRLLEAVLLDTASVSLLNALVETCLDTLRQHARKLGLFAGCPFGPGAENMPLETQALLFRLVDTRPIQVSLNESMAMHPLKSLSFFVQFITRKVETGRTARCRRCTLRNCQFRAR